MTKMQTPEAAQRPPCFRFEARPHGEGGFARVIRGRNNVLERDITVKVLHPLATRFSGPEQERFQREARILARLSHPNIPSPHRSHPLAGQSGVLTHRPVDAGRGDGSGRRGVCGGAARAMRHGESRSACQEQHATAGASRGN
jgi:hypothetical protein